MPNDYSKDIKKLLDLVEDDSIIEAKETENDTDKFIRSMNITEGDEFVHSLVIYYVYCQWRDRHRLGRNKFVGRFSEIFDRKVKSGEYGYMINNDDKLFDTSLEGKFAARAFFRKSKVIRGRQKKTKAKKK